MAARKKKTAEAVGYPVTVWQQQTGARWGYPGAATELDHAKIAAAEARRVRRGHRSA